MYRQVNELNMFKRKMANDVNSHKKMFMCMCIYIYLFIYAHMHIYIYICTYGYNFLKNTYSIYIYRYRYRYRYIYRYRYTHVAIYSYIYIYIRRPLRVSGRNRVHGSCYFLTILLSNQEATILPLRSSNQKASLNGAFGHLLAWCSGVKWVRFLAS